MVDKIISSVKGFIGNRTPAEAVMAVLIAILVGGLSVLGFTVKETPTPEVIVETQAEGSQIVLSDEHVTAVVETDTHELAQVDVATVEAIDNSSLLSECPDGEECGLGAYIYADVFTPDTFYNSAIGQCWNSDSSFGAQCWDEIDVLFQNTVGRRFNTCGTGAAKGTIKEGCWQKNAGSEFTMIWDASQIRKGDVVVFTNGQYGHVGMAMGPAVNGRVALLGQNQGGKACSGGGAAGNVINISLANFGGAFRYNGWDWIFYVPPTDDSGNIVMDGKG